MQTQTVESDHRPMRDARRGITAPIRAPLRWWRGAPTRVVVQQATSDFFESWVRVMRKTHRPTRTGVLHFLGNQVLVNAVAWTAGVTAAGLIRSFFEVRGVRNLWGLMASGDRTLVSPDDYHLIMTVASYSAGLVMLIVVRHLVLRLIAEFQALRFERAQGDREATSHD